MPNYTQEIAQILKSEFTDNEIREKLQNYHENDIAEAMKYLTEKEREKLYKILGVEWMSEVFSYLEDAQKYLNEMDQKQAASLLESMDADDAVDLLEDMETSTRDDLISLMKDQPKRDICLIRSFSEDEIGSYMATNFIVIQRGSTIRQAMKSLVEQAGKNDNIYMIYVTEQGGTFYGAIELKDLITAREGVLLDKITSENYPYVYADEKTEYCLGKLRDYAEESIPVLDENQRIVGVITMDDIVDVLDDEMGEDYAKFAGLTEEEDLKETLLESVKKRMPWLIVLLGLGLIVSSVVGLFESVVSQLTLIVCFQSLILDMAGNVGTQSLAVTIRVLTDGAIDSSQKFCLVKKEIKVGFFNGLILGVAAFIFIGLFIWIFKAKTFGFSYAVSGCIGVALLLSMVISSLVGTVIPLFFQSIKIDPAVASGPLITTVNDLVAVVTYYGLTWIFLIGFLQITG
ncbi:MAG: magnesium transporter [Clostridiales bacterium]|nr:magnesium transporter [Clostridiales bacterium]